MQNLIREKWTLKDGKEFQKYLIGLGNPERVLWTKNIINTNLPCLAIKAPVIKNTVKEIYKGNFLEFIDLWLWDYFENTTVIGGLICKIDDFSLMTKYLSLFAQRVDNWASCDMLSFNIKNANKIDYFDLAKNFIKSDKPFVRRIGVTIFFKFISDDKFLPEIFSILNGFNSESEYYVNMVNAWLVCECFIKQRDKTLKFLETNSLNKFTINKAVSKCRDSFRVSKEDKEFLLKYKR